MQHNLIDPSMFAGSAQPQWAAAHAYMLARGLDCASYCPGQEASYTPMGAGRYAPIVASLTGSRQPDGSYSIHVHGAAPQARRRQIDLAIVSGEYVDLPVAAGTPWIFRGREHAVACLRLGEQVAFVVGDWV